MLSACWDIVQSHIASTASPQTPMASSKKTSSHDPPTKLYFAYGSNLHMKQMKRRCPNSRYIGRARLCNYRWQINERGFANIVETPGRCVDGLVYEIDQKDEAKLDINEGVAKKAYEKRHLAVMLHRAHASLYRRPVSWIVAKGGPSAVCGQPKTQARLTHKSAQRQQQQFQHWLPDVLVYISPNHTQDSTPRDEYVKRLNLGIADARALGLDDDYICACIRPFLPETPSSLAAPSCSSASASSPQPRPKRPLPPSRTGERSSAAKRGRRRPTRPDQQNHHGALVRRTRKVRRHGARKRPRARIRLTGLVVIRRHRHHPIVVEEHISVGAWDLIPSA
ncbi:hypothetical protein CDD81_3123 [Ophiocordyceps australis]|uniref:gamma-glutamylcyclotransferase n=1 Tax=Ophiocordyceps australis TaxID=1399860 RepID=A0A2C5YE57_9HYPO|nr:hypothetical protein CDD81_3123 [Ophiocordyceps australis]